jgi:hypothetical protein
VTVAVDEDNEVAALSEELQELAMNMVIRSVQERTSVKELCVTPALD